MGALRKGRGEREAQHSIEKGRARTTETIQTDGAEVRKRSGQWLHVGTKGVQ